MIPDSSPNEQVIIFPFFPLLTGLALYLVKLFTVSRQHILVTLTNVFLAFPPGIKLLSHQLMNSCHEMWFGHVYIL